MEKYIFLPRITSFFLTKLNFSYVQANIAGIFHVKQTWAEQVSSGVSAKIIHSSFL